MAIYDPRLDNARRAAQQRQSPAVADLKSILSTTNGMGDPTAARQYAEFYPDSSGTPGVERQPEIDFGGGIKGILKHGIYAFSRTTAGQALFKGLEALDYGRRGAISLVDTAFVHQGTFKDWLRKTKDPTFGFGKVVKDPFGKAHGWGSAQKWFNGAIGFVGDVLLDPATYVTLGAGKVAISSAKAGGAAAAALDVLSAQGTREVAHITGFKGRSLLARAVLAASGNEERAAQIARYGRSILTEEEHAMLGLRRSGLYFAGKRLPMTTSVGKIDQMFAGTRLALGDGRAFIGSRTFARLGEIATPNEMKAARIAIARGQVPEGQFAEYLALAMAKPIKSKAAAAAATDFKQTAQQILGENPERFARNLPKTAYRDLEANTISPGGSLEKIQTFLKTLWEKQNNAVKEIDPAAADLRKVENYVPHLTARDAKRWLATAKGNMADSVRETLASITDDASIWKHRLQEGDIWFGHKLSQSDLNIDSLNRIARDKGMLKFDFFETDMQKILSHYGEQYSANGGALGIRQFLKEQGVFKMRDSKAVLDEDALAATKKHINDLYHGTAKTINEAQQVTNDLLKSVEALAKSGEGTGADALGPGFRAVDQGVAAAEKDLTKAEAAVAKAATGVDASQRAVDAAAQNVTAAEVKTAAANADVAAVVDRMKQLVIGLQTAKDEWTRVFNGQSFVAIEALKGAIEDSKTYVNDLVALVEDRTTRSADLQAMAKKIGEDLAAKQRLLNHITLHGNEIQGEIDRIVSGSVRYVKSDVKSAVGSFGATDKYVGDIGNAMRASGHVNKETLAAYIDGTSIVDTKSELWATAKKQVEAESAAAGRKLSSQEFRREQERVFTELGGDLTKRKPLDQQEWWIRAQGSRPVAKSEVKAMTEKEASRIASRALDGSVPLAKQRAALLWLGAQAQHRIDSGAAIPEWFGRIFDKGGVAERVAALDMFYNGMNATTKRGVTLGKMVSLQSNLRDVSRAVREGIHTYGASAFAYERLLGNWSASDTALDVIDKLRGSEEARWVFHEDGFLYRRLEELKFVGKDAEPKTVDQLRGVLREIRDAQFDKPMEIRYTLNGPAAALADAGEQTLQVRMSDLGLSAIDFDPSRFDTESLDRLANVVLSGGKMDKKGWVRISDGTASTRRESFENAYRRAQSNWVAVSNRDDASDAILDSAYERYSEIIDAWERRTAILKEIDATEQQIRKAQADADRIISGAQQKAVKNADGSVTMRSWTRQELDDLKKRMQVAVDSARERISGVKRTATDPTTGEVTSWYEGGWVQEVESIDNWYNNQYDLPAQPGSVFDDMNRIEKDLQSEFPALYNSKLLRTVAEDKSVVRGAVRKDVTTVMHEAERQTRSDVAQNLSRALVSDEISRRLGEATAVLLRHNLEPTPQLAVHVSQAVAAKHYESIAARTAVLHEVDSLISSSVKAVADLGEGATAEEMRAAIDEVLSRASVDAQDALRPYLHSAEARDISLRLQSNASYKRALEADRNSGLTYTKGLTFDSAEQRSVAAKLGHTRKEAKAWAQTALEKGNRGQRAVQRALKQQAKQIKSQGALGGSEREISKWLERMSAQAAAMLSDHRSGSAWIRELSDPFTPPERVFAIIAREGEAENLVGSIMEAFRQRGYELDALQRQEASLLAKRQETLAKVPVNVPMPNRIMTEAEQKARRAAARVAAREKIGPNEMERVNAVLRAIEDPSITTWDEVAESMRSTTRQSRKGLLGWLDTEPETKQALTEMFGLRKQMFEVRNSFDYTIQRRNETVFDVLDLLAGVRTAIKGEMDIPVYHSSADQARLILQENAASSRAAQAWNNPTVKVEGFGSADAATQHLVVEFPMQEEPHTWVTSLMHDHATGEYSMKQNASLRLVTDHTAVLDDRAYRVIVSGDGKLLSAKDAAAGTKLVKDIERLDTQLQAAVGKVNAAVVSGDEKVVEEAKQRFGVLARQREQAVADFKSRVGLRKLRSKAIDLTLDGERNTISRANLDRLFLQEPSRNLDYEVAYKRIFPTWEGDSVAPVFVLTDAQKESLGTLGKVGEAALDAAKQHEDAYMAAVAAHKAMEVDKGRLARLPEGASNAARRIIGDSIIEQQRNVEHALSVMRVSGEMLQELRPRVRSAWMQDGVRRSSEVTNMVNRIVNAIEDGQFTVADIKKALEMHGLEPAVDDVLRSHVDKAMGQWRDLINTRVLTKDPNAPQFLPNAWFPDRSVGNPTVTEFERLQSQYSNLLQKLQDKHVASVAAKRAEHAARLDRVEKTFLGIFGGSAHDVRARYNGLELLGPDGTSTRIIAHRPKDPKFLEDVITVGTRGEIKAKTAEMKALAESVAKIRVQPELAPRAGKAVSRTKGAVEAVDRGSGALLSVRKLPEKYAHLQWVTANADGSFLWDPMKRFQYLLETRPASRAETYGVAEAAAQVADEVSRLRPVGYNSIVDFEKSTAAVMAEIRSLTDEARTVAVQNAVSETQRIHFLLTQQTAMNHSLLLQAQLMELAAKHQQELIPIAQVGAEFEKWIKVGMQTVGKARANRDGLLAAEHEANRVLTAAKDAFKKSTAAFDAATAVRDAAAGEVQTRQMAAAAQQTLLTAQRDNLKKMVDGVNSIGLEAMVSRGAVSPIPESERAVISQRLSMLSDAVRDTESLMDDSAARWRDEITAIEARHANDPSTMRGLEDTANRSADATRWRKLTELVSYHEKFKAQAIDAQTRWNSVMLADDQMTEAWNRLADDAMSGAFSMQVAADLEKGFTTLDRIHMPSHVARQEILDMVQNVRKVPTGPLRYWMKEYTNFFRAYALLAPGVAVRNFLSNTFMLMVAGTSAEAWQEGFGLYRAYRKAWHSGELEKWFASLGEREAVVRHAVGIMDSVGGGQTENAFGAVAHNRLYNNRFVAKSRKFNSWVEHVGRFTLAYDSALKGMDLHGGYARVSKYLFDYSDVSALDETMRQIVPFWFWMSRNMPLQWQSRWTNPRMYAMWNSFERNFADPNAPDTPLWMRESGGFSLSNGLGFVSFNPADSADERIHTLLTNPKRLLADVNPLFRVGPEVAGNRKYYNDMPFGAKHQTPIAWPFGTLLLTPVKDRDGKVSQRWNYFLKSMIPPAAQGERLFGASYDGKHGNSWLSFIGSPVRQISPEDRQQEHDRAKKVADKAKAAANKREVDEMLKKLDKKK